MTVSYVNAVRELSKKMKSEVVCNMVAEVLKLKFVCVYTSYEKNNHFSRLFSKHKSYKKAATDIETQISENSMPLASLLQDVFSLECHERLITTILGPFCLYVSNYFPLLPRGTKTC